MLSLPEKRAAFITLPQVFNRLPQVGFSFDDVTSPATPQYNCIAYAAKDETRRWWPLPYEMGGRHFYWPPDLPREHPATVNNFFGAFNLLGFKRCSNGKYEYGFEKVVIYVDPANIPTHMAREIGEGVWHSKLGIEGYDVRHHLFDAVECPTYGKAKYFMRRPLEGYTRWKRIKGKLQRILSSSKTSQRIL